VESSPGGRGKGDHRGGATVKLNPGSGREKEGGPNLGGVCKKIIKKTGLRPNRKKKTKKRSMGGGGVLTQNPSLETLRPKSEEVPGKGGGGGGKGAGKAGGGTGKMPKSRKKKKVQTSHTHKRTRGETNAVREHTGRVELTLAEN